MIDQVSKRLAADGHLQPLHVREIGGGQVAGLVDLREHHLLVRPLGGAPSADLSLEGSPLAVRELPLGLLLQPAEQRDRSQLRLLSQTLLDRRPDLNERISSSPPLAGRRALGGQLFDAPVLACRFLIHARLPCRKRQSSSCGQQPKQLSHLTVLDHRNLLFLKGVAIVIETGETGNSSCRWSPPGPSALQPKTGSSNRRSPGEVVVALQAG
jgi:hypothetical protein